MKLLDGIDPNPENYVSAGIIHTRTQQIGCLLRLEPNRQAQVQLKISNITRDLTSFFGSSIDVSSDDSFQQGFCGKADMRASVRSILKSVRAK